MDFKGDLLKRANLFQICSFLLFGTESEQPPDDHRRWRDATYSELSARMHREFPEGDVYEEILALIFAYTDAVQYSCMITGIQVGMKLTKELSGHA